MFSMEATKYKKSSSVLFFKSQDKFVVGYGSNQILVDEKEFRKIEIVLNYLKNEKSVNDFRQFIQNQDDIDEAFINFMIKHKFITTNKYVLKDYDNVDFKNRIYVDSFIENSEKAIENIRKSTLINIGCGGVGNYLLFSYCSFLPQKIIILDGDTVSKTNLNRQILFDNNDIGKNKCEVLEHKLKLRFPSVDIESYKEHSTEKVLSNILKKMKNKQNVILSISGDEEDTVKETIKLAHKYGVACINSGYFNDISAIGPFYIPSYSACPFCMDIGSGYEDNYYDYFKEVNNSYRAPSSFINSSMAASMAMVDILYYFSEDYDKINSLNKRVGIHNSNFKKEEIEISRNERCPVCGTE